MAQVFKITKLNKQWKEMIFFFLAIKKVARKILHIMLIPSGLHCFDLHLDTYFCHMYNDNDF